MTVRVAPAADPVLVFAVQFVEGRLRASAWSLAALVAYSTWAALTATARQWRVAARRRAIGERCPSRAA